MEIVKQVFEGQEIRMVEVEGEAWMVASDVAKALGYRDAGNMTRLLDEDEKGTQIVSTLGGSQEVAIVNEAGIYRAIFASRKDEARHFKRWLAHEVLPTLRRTGFYSMREPVVTIAAIARAYGLTSKNIPYYLEQHGIAAIGQAEHPDTGKMMPLFPPDRVRACFMGGTGPARGELRPYSGAWERVPQALAS